MSNLVAPLLPLVLPTLLSVLPLPPRLRSPQATRLLLIALTTLYILYTFISSDLAHSSTENFYSLLSLPRNIAQEDIASGWRNFARRNHPDRLAGAGVEERFVKATAAKNVLSDEVRRWAYDRFGESVGRWRGVVTEREFLISGLMNSIGFYVVSAGVLAFWSLTGQSSGRTAFWRNLSLPILFILELSLYILPTPDPLQTLTSSLQTSSTYTHPYPLRLLAYLFPQRTQHQQIQLLHNFYLCFSMVLNQLVPLLFPRQPDVQSTMAGKSVEEREKELAVVAERLAVMVSVAEMEAARIYKSELTPILSTPASHSTEPSRPGPALESIFKSEMEQVLIDHRIRSHPAVAPIWGKAIDDARSKEAQSVDGDLRRYGADGEDEEAGSEEGGNPHLD